MSDEQKKLVLDDEHRRKGAVRYATEAARLYRDGIIRGGGGERTADVLVPKYFEAMIDAYNTGSIEAVKMLNGDFTPEPWQD